MLVKSLSLSELKPLLANVEQSINVRWINNEFRREPRRTKEKIIENSFHSACALSGFAKPLLKQISRFSHDFASCIEVDVYFLVKRKPKQ